MPARKPRSSFLSQVIRWRLHHRRHICSTLSPPRQSSAQRVNKQSNQSSQSNSWHQLQTVFFHEQNKGHLIIVGPGTKYNLRPTATDDSIIIIVSIIILIIISLISLSPLTEDVGINQPGDDDHQHGCRPLKAGVSWSEAFRCINTIPRGNNINVYVSGLTEATAVAHKLVEFSWNETHCGDLEPCWTLQFLCWPQEAGSESVPINLHLYSSIIHTHNRFLVWYKNSFKTLQDQSLELM